MSVLAPSLPVEPLIDSLIEDRIRVSQRSVPNATVETQSKKVSDSHAENESVIKPKCIT